jgi:hypothetical protein
LDAEPGPGRVELQLATTKHNTDMCVELIPDQVRAVSSALLKLADIAVRHQRGTDTSAIVSPAHAAEAGGYWPLLARWRSSAVSGGLTNPRISAQLALRQELHILPPPRQVHQQARHPVVA